MRTNNYLQKILHHQWLSFITVCIAIFLAFLARLPGYDGRAFWTDELWRVNLILQDNPFSMYWESPNLYSAITAPAYLALNNIIALFSTNPFILRISSLLPGLLSVLIAYLIAQRAGAGIVLSFAASMLISFNYSFIQYSNELKPYMFEVFIHLYCFYLWFTMINEAHISNKKWALFTVTIIFSALSSANIVFVLPAFAVSLLIKSWINSNRNFTPFFISFLIIGFTVIILYKFVWAYGADKGLIDYWADNFYNPSKESYLYFIFSKLSGIYFGAFFTIGANHKIIIIITIILFFISKIIFFFFSKRKNHNIFYIVIAYDIVLVTTMIFINRIGLWPLGEIRPNLFLFALIAMLWVIHLALLLPGSLKIGTGLIISIIILAGAAKFKYSKVGGLAAKVEQNDRVWADFYPEGAAGRIIQEACKDKPVLVFLNPGTSMAFTYYTLHATHVAKNKLIETGCIKTIPIHNAYSDPDILTKKINSVLPLKGITWFTYGHLELDEINKLKSIASRYGRISNEKVFISAGYFSVVPNQ